MTACLGGSDKEIGENLEIGEYLEIGENLEIGKDHECGELFNAEGEFFFLRKGGVQRYPIGFPCAVTVRESEHRPESRQ